jgi:hypothetical protein
MMDKKIMRKYLIWFLALAAVVFAIAGWYYTGGAQTVEGFFGGKSVNDNKEGMAVVGVSGDSCSVGTCG